MLSLLIRFIGRLSVGRKLVLIYVLDLSAVIFVSGILINEKFIAIDFARKEILGNQYIAVVSDVLLSLPSLAGKQDSKIEEIRHAEQAFGEGMASAEAAEAFIKALSQQGVTHLQPAIESGKALITRIGNQSNLILDPDLDSYYTMSLIVLRFPELFDVIDLIRHKLAEAKGLSGRQLSRVQTDYLILEGRLDAVAKGMESDYEEAIAAGQLPLKVALGKSQISLLEAIKLFREQTRQVIIEESSEHGLPGVEVAAESLIAQLNIAWHGAGLALGDLLHTRVEGFFNRMWLHLGTATGLLMLILSVVYFVARQIALPVRRLADVADQVSVTGNYELRANWRSGDEIGRLVDGFNGMLAQLNRSRLIEQEMAASARAAVAQRELLEAFPVPLVVTSIPEHNILHSNQPAERWLAGRQSDPWLNGLIPSARARFFQQLADQGEVNQFEVQWLADNKINWALLSARRLRYQEHDALLTTFTPINKLKAMEQRLELWAKVFEASSESIMITDDEQRIVTVNRAFCRNTGYDLVEIIGETPGILRSSHHPAGFIEDIWHKAATRGSWQGELWLQRKTGESFPLWGVVNSVRNEGGEISHFIAVALDISEHKANEERISHLAHHDVLTDLPNRSLCRERLRLALQVAARNQYRVGVLFLDLDRFKNINDSLGHHIGDGLLRSVAQCLLAVVRAGDTVSRLGGDEFVIVFNEIKDAEEIMQIVDQRLIPLMSRPHDVEGAELHVSCSIGIAIFPEDGTEIDTLMRNADAAMYQAKSAGRNNAQLFTQEMEFQARERLGIENDLRYAVERNELQLYYQPKVSAKGRVLLGAEALVRWLHPEQGLVSPARFIPIAEESGLILPIGQWIIEEACRQHAEWRDQGLGEIPLSINLSAAQLRDTALIGTLQSAFETWAINPMKIELELTESLLMEQISSTINILHSLKQLGVSLSIDDFGTGYSSLNYLHRFPIDKLKIDQCFVRDMRVDPDDLAITRAIIGLGHTLGLQVVAEGVEHEEEAGMLAAAGCDELQGYLFSRPLPASDFISWKIA